MTRKHWFGSPAATYAHLVPIMAHAARELGYVLALHGSMNFDVDLVAVPWTEDAAAPEALLDALSSAIGATHEVTNQTVGPTPKPHGRQAWLIPLGCGLYIDLSVMPKR